MRYRLCSWWLGVALCVAAVLLIALAWMMGPQAGRVAEVQGPASPRFAIRGLRTSVYRKDRLQARVSADSIKVTSPRMLGPFRIGFLRSIAAKNVTIEAYEEPLVEGGPVAGEQNKATLPLTSALASLAPRSLQGRITAAEVEGLRFARYRGDHVTVAVGAARCEATAKPSAAVCHDGVLRNGDAEVGFREASFDGRQWRVDVPRRRADEDGPSGTAPADLPLTPSGGLR